MRFALASALMLTLAAAAQAGPIVSTFSDVPIGPNGSSSNPAGGGFTVDGNFYNNVSYSPTGEYWSGWAFSNQTMAQSGTAFGMYAAVTETNPAGTNTYAVVNSYHGTNSQYDTLGYINLAAGRIAGSLDVTNVAYVYNAITQGSPFDTTFKAGDYFTLTIQGLSGANATGSLVNSLTIDLARYGTSLSFLSTWKTIDLTSFGDSRSINFVFASNVANAAGPTVPTFAAIDNFTTLDATAVPEPTTWVMLGIGVVAVCGVRRRNV